MTNYLKGNKYSFSSAFTLIELLMVIGVLGVMAGFLLVNYASAGRRARDTHRRNDLKQYQAALEIYASNNNNAYPAGTGNVTALCATLGLAGSKCVDDPRPPLHYQYQSIDSNAGYVLWAELEVEDLSGSTEYFIACSNGLAGEGGAPGLPVAACPL